VSTSPQPSPGASEIGTILAQSFNLYFGRFAQSIIIPVVVLLPAYILRAIIQGLFWRLFWGTAFHGGIGGLASLGGNFIVDLLLGFIQWGAYALTLALVAKVVESQIAGKSISLSEAYRSIPRASLITTAALFGIATAIGWYLLVLPGLAVWFFLCLAMPAVALDREEPLAALARSVRAVLKVPVEIVVILLIFVAYFFVGGIIAGAFFFVGGFYTVSILTGIVYLLIAPWLGISLALCYNRAKTLGA